MPPDLVKVFLRGTTAWSTGIGSLKFVALCCDSRSLEVLRPQLWSIFSWTIIDSGDFRVNTEVVFISASLFVVVCKFDFENLAVSVDNSALPWPKPFSRSVLYCWLRLPRMVESEVLVYGSCANGRRPMLACLLIPSISDSSQRRKLKFPGLFWLKLP